MTDLTIRNATLVPCTPGMPVIDRGHVSVAGGVIVSAGSGPGPDAADILDAGGDIVMPGMVNPHAHLPMTLFRGLGEDVDDRLFRYVLPMERKFVTPEMVRTGTALAAWESIRAGVTAVADMYYFEAEVGRVLDTAGLRGVVGQTLADFDPPDHATMDEGFDLVEALAEEFRGHPRIVPSVAPHAPYSTDIPVLERIADWAAAHPDVPVQIHLAEMASEMDWASRTHGCRPVEVVDRAGLLRNGLIAAHCLYLDEAEIARLAETGRPRRTQCPVQRQGRPRHRTGGGDACHRYPGGHRHRRPDEWQYASISSLNSGRFRCFRNFWVTAANRCPPAMSFIWPRSRVHACWVSTA